MTFLIVINFSHPCALTGLFRGACSAVRVVTNTAAYSLSRGRLNTTVSDNFETRDNTFECTAKYVLLQLRQNC